MSLEELRARVAEADRDLLDAWARREAAVRAIGRFKVERNLPIHDPAQEGPVLERSRAGAEERGLPADAAERVLRVVMETSLARQEAIRIQSRRHGAGRRALVIGGGGRMGRWFAAFLSEQAYEVTAADPAGGPPGVPTVWDWREAEGGAWDVTVVAAPILESARVLEAMARTGWPGLVFDVGSVKAPLAPALVRLVERGLLAASVHPMFGPDAKLLHGRHILVLDAGNTEAADRAATLFGDTMAEILRLPLADHDPLIAYVLGLSHALNLAFLDALRTSGEQMPRLAGISSVTFDRQLRVSAAVADENPSLYYEIQRLNPHGERALAGLSEAVARLRKAVSGAREETFVRFMEAGRAWVHSRRAPGAARVDPRT